MQNTGIDVLTSLQTIYTNSADKTDVPTSVSAQWDQPGTVCRFNWDNQSSVPCTTFDPTKAPVFKIDHIAFGTSAAFQEGTASIPSSYYGSTVVNAFQTVHAAVRLDLGYALSNNLYTNTAAVLEGNQTITPLRNLLGPAPGGAAGVIPYTAPTPLWQGLTTSGFFALPVNGTLKSTIDVPYMCQSTVKKEPGAILVAIFVATATMIATGWGIIKLIATYFATRDREYVCSGTRHAD